VPQVEAVPSRAMPAMSKIAIAATAGAAVTCFVAPGARRVQATTAPALRGQGSTGSSAGLSSMGIAGLAAVALAAGRPTAQRGSIAVQAYDASKEIGACDPLLFWDPIGYCGGDCTKEDFDRRRAVELKHGRICMFATIGMLWPDIFGKFDGFFVSIPELEVRRCSFGHRCH